jgi:Raf kinase inhibitor-like YbhB/YbcL family protein
MRLTSPAFDNGGVMPARFAQTGVAGGENVSVPVSWDGVPKSTESFTLALIDHHPIAHGWVHWLVVDIPGDVRELPEGASQLAMPPGAIEHDSSYGSPGYGGPQPPAGSGSHDYVFTLFALDVPRLGVREDAIWDEVREALDAHVLESATLRGTFRG